MLRLVAPVRLLVCIVPGLVTLAWHARRYYPFIADDSLISLRYADRLIHGLGLTWTDGERVEGYSNLLWVLANAMLGACGVDLILASRILGAAGMGGALGWVSTAGFAEGWRGAIVGSLAGMLLAAHGSVAVWTVGGLEQPFVALLLAIALVGAERIMDAEPRIHLSAAALALLCLTRPDAPLLVAMVCLGLLLGMGPSRRSLMTAVRVGLPSVVAVLGQLAFRIVYYDDWVANTARAKVAFSRERLELGLGYLVSTWQTSFPLILLAAATTLFARARWRRLLPAWLVAIAWAGYVAFIGGDIFPGLRHSIVMLVALGYVVVRGAPALFERKAYFVVLAGGLALGVGATARIAFADPENQRAIDERWEFEGEVVGRMLRQAFSAQAPLLAVDPAGCLPYFSGLPSLDMLGLNDRYLAHHPPPDLGHGYVGHELGDGAYVFGRAPDLVVFCSPRGSHGPCFRGGIELVAQPGFGRHYRAVDFLGTTPFPVRSTIYVRNQGRIGMRVSADRIEVPGFFFGSGDNVATLDERGQVGTRIAAGTAARLWVHDAEGGRYRAEFFGEGDPSITAQGPLVTIVAGATPAFVRGVTLTRIR